MRTTSPFDPLFKTSRDVLEAHKIILSIDETAFIYFIILKLRGFWVLGLFMEKRRQKGMSESNLWGLMYDVIEERNKFVVKKLFRVWKVKSFRNVYLASILN